MSIPLAIIVIAATIALPLVAVWYSVNEAAMDKKEDDKHGS